MCIRDSSYTEHTNGIPQNSSMQANVIYTSQTDVLSLIHICWQSCWPQRAISTKYILRKSADKGVFRL